MRQSRKLYGNCVVLSGDIAMFRCDEDRMNWYLDNQLATVVSADPPVIRLTFSPKGLGHAGDPYFLQEFKNLCVVCGTKDRLSHHHIVPYCYRRYFPKDSYDHGRWFYDVLLLCVQCHKKYERRANELKIEIAKEHGVDPSGLSTITRDIAVLIKAAAALFRHGDKLPPEKKEKFERMLTEHLGKDRLEKGDAESFYRKTIANVQITPAGEIVVKELSDVDDFAIRWRRHFMKHMKPRFLPQLWDAERRIYSEPDQVTGK